MFGSAGKKTASTGSRRLAATVTVVLVFCIGMSVANAATPSTPASAAKLQIAQPTADMVDVTGSGFPKSSPVVLSAQLANCVGTTQLTSTATGTVSTTFRAATGCQGIATISATSGVVTATGRATLGAPRGPVVATAPTGVVHLGAAIEPEQLDDPEFADALVQYGFDSLTPENAMKQQNIHPSLDTYNWEGADKIVEFAQANNMRVRGHTLLWYRDPPSWLSEVAAGEEARAAMQEHIQTIVGRYRGKIAQWDVVNEALEDDGTPRVEDMWREKVGDDYIELAFQYTHEADPSAVLFYNEFSAESRDLDGNGGTGRAAKSDAVYAMVQDFVARGVPIGGVGLQTHSSGLYPGTEASLTENMARITALGVATEITELDVKDVDDQAARYAEVGAACKAAGCTGVTTWGLYDGHTWLDGADPLLLDTTFQPKPAYDALIAAIGR